MGASVKVIKVIQKHNHGPKSECMVKMTLSNRLLFAKEASKQK